MLSKATRWFIALTLGPILLTLVGQEVYMWIDPAYAAQVRGENERMDRARDIDRQRRGEATKRQAVSFQAYLAAKQAVKERLKAPATAEFCSYGDSVVKNPDGAIWIASGYVDAQNTFGAKLRSKWIVKLVDRGSTWGVEDVALF